MLRHIDYPDLDLQIPGGTVEANEAPADAAAREALEETGLTALGTPEFLGVANLKSFRIDEDSLEAWFFRLEVVGDVPEVWLHTELHGSEANGVVRFELSWLPIADADKRLSHADCLMLDAALCLN